MKRDQADRRTSHGSAPRSTAMARWPVGALLSAAPPAQAWVLEASLTGMFKTVAWKSGFAAHGTAAAAMATATRDSLLGLSQTEMSKRAPTVSSYRRFVPPSAETEKVLTAWFGL